MKRIHHQCHFFGSGNTRCLDAYILASEGVVVLAVSFGVRMDIGIEDHPLGIAAIRFGSSCTLLRGIQSRESEKAVAESVPAPVDAKESFRIHTVAHKSMAFVLDGACADIDRSSRFQVGSHPVQDRILGNIVFGQDPDSFVVAKMVDECIDHLFGLGTAGVYTIIHV